MMRETMTDEDEDRFQIETAFWLLEHANAARARGDDAEAGFRAAASMLMERAGWAGDDDGAAESSWHLGGTVVAKPRKARCYSLKGTTQTQHDALLWFRAVATGVREPRDVVESLSVEGWEWGDVHQSWRGPLRRWRSLRHADRIRIAERFMWHRFSERAVPMENR